MIPPHAGLMFTFVSLSSFDTMVCLGSLSVKTASGGAAQYCIASDIRPESPGTEGAKSFNLMPAMKPQVPSVEHGTFLSCCSNYAPRGRTTRRGKVFTPG